MAYSTWNNRNRAKNGFLLSMQLTTSTTILQSALPVAPAAAAALLHTAIVVNHLKVHSKEPICGLHADDALRSANYYSYGNS